MNDNVKLLVQKLEKRYIQSFSEELFTYLKQFENTDVIFTEINGKPQSFTLSKVEKADGTYKNFTIGFTIYFRYSTHKPVENEYKYAKNSLYLCDGKLRFPIERQEYKYIYEIGDDNKDIRNTFIKIIGADIENYILDLADRWDKENSIAAKKIAVEYAAKNKEIYIKYVNELKTMITQYKPEFNLSAVDDIDLCMHVDWYWDKNDRSYFHHNMLDILKDELVKVKPHKCKTIDIFKVVEYKVLSYDRINITIVRSDASDRIIAALSYDNSKCLDIKNNYIHFLSSSLELRTSYPLQFCNSEKTKISFDIDVDSVMLFLINASSKIPNFNFYTYKREFLRKHQQPFYLVRNEEENRIQHMFINELDEKIKEIKKYC